MKRNIKKSLISTLRHRYIMPVEAKLQLAEKNNKKLVYLQIFLVTASIIYTAFQLLFRFKTISNNFYSFISSCTLTVCGIIVLLYCHNIKKTVKKTPAKLMFPLYFTFLYLYILLGTLFYTNHSLFTSFLIFASISIIAPLYFDVEPFTFAIMEFTVSGAIAHQTYTSSGLTPTIDIFIFLIITVVLSLNKWRTTKSDYQYKKNQNEYKERIEKEISLAALVQTSFFKHKENLFDDWTITYYTKAMSGVSGDFIDIYDNGNKLEGIGIFDVSGHGIASGLVTMLVKNIIINEFQHGKTDKLKTVIDRINVRYLHEKGNIENYLTGILCRLKDNTINFVNAGHSMPILYKNSEEHCVEIRNDNNEGAYGAIGLIGMPSNFVEHNVEMESGDELILFTDGITDATNDSREPFGRDRLIRSINRNADRPLTTQINCIVSDVMNYSHDHPLEDDITMIILRKK